MGEQYKPILNDTFTANGAVPANRFVNHAGALCGANAKAKGISIFGVNDGKRGDLVMIGTAVLELGEAVEPGDELTSDALGRGVKVANLAAAIAAHTHTLSGAAVSNASSAVNIAAGETPVLSSAANGAIGTAAGQAATVTQPTAAETTATATLSGGALPQKKNAVALESGSGVGAKIEVLLVA